MVERLRTTKSDSQSDTSDDEEEDEDELSQCEQTSNKTYKTIELKDLYVAALALRQNIREYCSLLYENWPPLASDITQESVRKVVSPLLNNFVAWLLGYSEEPQDSSYVDMDEEYAVKVYSLCQDLVYNGNKGITQTPKSLAQAMAVRQMSGCSGLIYILNGLGHCVSLSSTMAYDSAIAQLVIETSDIVPREFVAGQSINLVYDNIDRLVKKSRFNIEMEEVTGSITVKTAASEAAQLLHLTCVLLKMIPSDDLPVLPRWTGLNTLLRKDNIPNI